jgi:putative tricarboxylic transport membrane protein
MGVLDYIVESLKQISTLTGIIYIIGGTMAGIVLGAIPGLGSSTLLVILLPIAYKIDTNLVLALFISVVIGGMSGGCIGSILLGIPGTSSSLCTVWDGYALTKQGDPVRPLSAAVTANFIGNVPSVILAVFAVRLIGTWAVKLGPWEYAALCFCAILMVVGLSKGNLAKGMLGVGLAIFMASVGEDPITAHGRFLFFGRLEFLRGFNLISVMLGLFAAKIILLEYARATKTEEQVDIKVGGYKWPGKDLRENKWVVIRSWFLGVFIGFLPGLGGPVAAGMAYSTEKMLAKDKSKWGRGEIAGVWATETSNNAAIGGALIPLLSLGIPGDAANVQFIAALNVKGISVGPMFIREQPLIVYIIFIAAIISGIVAMLYQTLGMKTFPALLKIPYHYLYSMIAILTLTGAYMSTGSFFGMLVMLFSCILGVLMDIFGIPSLPFLMAFILSPILELNIRRGFNYSANGLAEFFRRPISAAFIILGLGVMLYGIVSPIIKKALKKDKETVDC